MLRAIVVEAGLRCIVLQLFLVVEVLVPLLGVVLALVLVFCSAAVGIPLLLLMMMFFIMSMLLCVVFAFV